MNGASVKCPFCSFDANGKTSPCDRKDNVLWRLVWHVNAEHQSELFHCPRRPSVGGEPGTNERDFWIDTHGYRACNYCWSAHPDDVMAGIESGEVQIDPTDKNYKAYIIGQMFKGGAKFYFQHLSVEQMARFIELYNVARLNIGYPGKFYVHPYFCKVEN